jgi:hypothetical protein
MYNRELDEDDLYKNITCPKCNRSGVQGLYRLTAKSSILKHLFYCTYSDCHYEWDDEEMNLIEELKHECIEMLNNCENSETMKEIYSKVLEITHKENTK